MQIIQVIIQALSRVFTSFTDYVVFAVGRVDHAGFDVKV